MNKLILLILLGLCGCLPVALTDQEKTILSVCDAEGLMVFRDASYNIIGCYVTDRK